MCVCVCISILNMVANFISIVENCMVYELQAPCLWILPLWILSFASAIHWIFLIENCWMSSHEC